MNCSDLLLLQRLLDGDLDETQAELIAHHVESCAECQAVTKELASARSFVEERLGNEDEGEDETTAAAAARIRQRLPAAPTAPERIASWWRGRLMAAAAVVALALFLPMFVSSVRAWPTRILEKASARERNWKYQPNRILYWEVDTVTRGLKNTADGRWRTQFWQKNGTNRFSQVTRQSDSRGRTEFAYWLQGDGSIIKYRRKDGPLVEIAPATPLLEQSLATLSPDLRAALQSYLTRREDMRNIDFNSRHDADWLHRPSGGSGKVSFSRGALDRWSDVYHITVEKGPPPTNPAILRAVHEYDIESKNLRILRLKSTISYADGTTGVQESRWISFREIPRTEFDAQTPQRLLEQGLAVVRLTPNDLAQRRLLELKQQ
jgi:hypothetical protein